MKIDPPVNFDDWRSLASEVTWSWYQATRMERDDLRAEVARQTKRGDTLDKLMGEDIKRLAKLETAAREAVTEWNRIENITPDFADEWTPFMDKLDAALAKEGR